LEYVGLPVFDVEESIAKNASASPIADVAAVVPVDVTSVVVSFVGLAALPTAAQLPAAGSLYSPIQSSSPAASVPASWVNVHEVSPPVATVQPTQVLTEADVLLRITFHV
jgi:hypothetical protein